MSSAAGDFRLEHDAWGQLILVTADGQRHIGVMPVRAFPVTDPEHWISICAADGHEILTVENSADLPPDVRQAIEDDLAQREFTPIIRRILSASHDEPLQWVVETDRGRTCFQINGEDDVRRIEPCTASILDSHAVRYLIPDVRRLDGASRRLLAYFL
jgi:hypothetical protein